MDLTAFYLSITFIIKTPSSNINFAFSHHFGGIPDFDVHKSHANVRAKGIGNKLLYDQNQYQ